jgi:hypothetical protein
MATVTPARVNRHWEEEMLGEYLARFHARCRVVSRVRLGPHGTYIPDPTLTADEMRLLGSAFRRWADAMCIEGDRLNVIETALIPDPRDISLLESYLALVEVTPELLEVRALPRHGILVWAVDDPYSRRLALAHGMEVVIYKPTFFGEWLATVRARERRPARTGLVAPSVAPTGTTR